MKTMRNNLLAATRSEFSFKLCVTVVLAVALLSATNAQTPQHNKQSGSARSASGNGTLFAPLTSGSAVKGSGTAGMIPKWLDSSTVGDSVISEASGKIGIGTASPGSMLSVAGMIETTLGGYKFPDGTIQTSAALGSVAHNATLTGNGTGASPLGVAIPLALNGSSSSPILQVTQNGASSFAISAIGNLVAIVGSSTNGIGVRGFTQSGAGVSGASVGFHGVEGTSQSGAGVFGSSNSSHGVEGSSQNGFGVHGTSNTGVGVVGEGNDQPGVEGDSNTGPGVIGTRNATAGVAGFSTNAFAVQGQGPIGGGVLGISNTNVGVQGISTNNIAVFGSAINDTGVGGISNNGDGVFGRASAGHFAGKFDGDVQVNGNLSKSSGSFKIDHPLDPENKYLYHSFVESPDMMNIYNGNVTTDANGDAVIALPDWFEALNKDFRYQLTVVGTFAQAIVAEKVKGNRFAIKTNVPNVEVSWQVTGVRQDAWANAHRIPLEERKTVKEQGHYLHPELFNQPEEKSIEWAIHPQRMQHVKLITEQMKQKAQTNNQ